MEVAEGEVRIETVVWAGRGAQNDGSGGLGLGGEPSPKKSKGEGGAVLFISKLPTSFTRLCLITLSYLH